MIIEKFKPLEFFKKDLNIKDLNKKTGVNWIYASSGKAALYHCLQSLNIKGKVLVPVYICSSILKPLKQLGLSYSCFDINPIDLNVDINDLKKKIINQKVNCVLAASMYGNPANMDEIEMLCKKYNIPLIDDAAQSFGSKCSGKFIGTFGDAGFFSFSPGKATPGHLGAFFWTKNKFYSIKRTNHYLLHKLAYWDFYFNRYKIYRFNKFKIFKILTYIKYIIFQLIDLNNDKINEFEKSILGGIILANHQQTFRELELKYIAEKFSSIPCVKLVTMGKENSNNHKIVFTCNSTKLAKLLMKYLNKSSIYASGGYLLLKNGINCPNAISIASRIIEIPLENSQKKNKYIIKKIERLINKL